jgi:precorrin-6Y C5,15-methyltransferase (decarboxylating)
MASRIHVVGLGVESGGRLNKNAESALQSAEVIIGAERQLSWLRDMYQPDHWPTTETLPKLSELEDLLGQYQGEAAVLASGDPLYFGIGRWLSQHFPDSKLKFHSATSSVQAVCSRLGLALQDCTVLSLHGRPLASLNRYLHSGRKLIVLTDKYSHPGALAKACVDAGLEQSTLWVCEQLGYPDEKIHRIEVAHFDTFEVNEFSDLQVSVLELTGQGGSIPSFPGIDDKSLITDGEPGQGMITKREVRVQILSLLQAGENQVVWDVGAGCGGVSTELALWQPGAKVIAIEQHPKRLECLNLNRERFGNFNLDIVAGRAPQALESLADPDRIFIGGSDGELESLLELCWRRLAADGVLVVSAVTDSTRQQLESFASHIGDAGIQSVQIAVKRGKFQDGQWLQQEKRPVTLFRFSKMECEHHD